MKRIRHAGKINTMVLDKIAEVIKEGMSTEELNKIAHEYTIQLGGTPAPLNYHGFPKIFVLQLMKLFVTEFQVMMKSKIRRYRKC